MTDIGKSRLYVEPNTKFFMSRQGSSPKDACMKIYDAPKPFYIEDV